MMNCQFCIKRLDKPYTQDSVNDYYCCWVCDARFSLAKATGQLCHGFFEFDYHQKHYFFHLYYAENYSELVCQNVGTICRMECLPDISPQNIRAKIKTLLIYS